MRKIAISVKQPWAYLLCAGMKPIENRTWSLPESYRLEQIYIHVSAKFDGFARFTSEQKAEIQHITDAEIYEHSSAIIGSIQFVDCVINHPSIWAEKTEVLTDESGLPYYGKKIYNWVTAKPILFEKPILDVKGQLKFWDCSQDIK